MPGTTKPGPPKRPGPVRQNSGAAHSAVLPACGAPLGRVEAVPSVHDPPVGDGPQAVSDSTTAYQIYGGYKFNDHLAVELGIGRTGDIEADIDDSIPPLGPVTLEIDGQYDIYALRVLGLNRPQADDRTLATATTMGSNGTCAVGRIPTNAVDD